MDLDDTRKAVSIAGFPQELIDRIWKKKSDDRLVNDYLAMKKAEDGENR